MNNKFVKILIFLSNGFIFNNNPHAIAGNAITPTFVNELPLIKLKMIIPIIDINIVL